MTINTPIFKISTPEPRAFVTEIDECAENPCQNNGTCLDLINDYQCNCAAGFNDTNCTNSKCMRVNRIKIFQRKR